MLALLVCILLLLACQWSIIAVSTDFHPAEYAQTMSCRKRYNILLLYSVYTSRCASCVYCDCRTESSTDSLDVSKTEWSNERVSRSSPTDGNSNFCEGDCILLKEVVILSRRIFLWFLYIGA